MNKKLFTPVTVASCIALILIGAAVMKWLFPAARDANLFFILGGIELVLAVGLVLFASSWQVWVMLALIVAAWAGFSLYTTVFGLPCGCLGGAFEFPRGTTLALNGVMLMGTWFVLNQHLARPLPLKRIGVFFVLGFAAAYLYYQVLI
jgi:hypothetical protein